MNSFVSGVCLLLILAALQVPLERAMLEEEDARVENPRTLLQALSNPNPRIQRVAVRALGRFERPEFADTIRPLLASPDPSVKIEAVNAFGQMNASFDYRALLETEQDGRVRSVIYETIGRLGDVMPGTEEALVRGLNDREVDARAGAAKGLETLFRLHRASLKPAPATIAALRDAVRNNTSAPLRQLALLTLNAAGDADSATLALALEDPEPQVRRLGVIGSKQWKDDASPIVRYEALRVAGNCERAAAALRDSSDHVALFAIDQLGNNCPAGSLERIIDDEKDWRRQSRALVSLAKVDPASARKRIGKFIEHSQWQARVYAAGAAGLIKDGGSLARLARDKNPNVVSATLVTQQDAVRVLNSADYGLIYQAATMLKGWPDGRLAVPALSSALERISREKKATSRDIRLEILQRLREFGDSRVAAELRPMLSDFDPIVARAVADLITEKTGAKAEPRTRRYVTSPLPADSYIRRLAGATARVKLKEAGVLIMRLFMDETPATAAVFAQLAEKGYYNGLTIHRIAPNFVVQGGSPGGNEYAGIGPFMRDELGSASNVRGSVGLSTRGRDTGDAQFYINLIDNFRLDHNYTVFAQITDGIENIDKIQEGDVIETIEIRRPVRSQ